MKRVFFSVSLGAILVAALWVAMPRLGHFRFPGSSEEAHSGRSPEGDAGSSVTAPEAKASFEERKRDIVSRFGSADPKEWGLRATGVKTRLATADPVIALTFDACGGTGKDGYDEKLISFLDEEHIPATLFLSGKWIDANGPVVDGLKNDPLFEIGNHGWGHVPCSVRAESAYGINGAGSVGGIVDEVEKNAEKIGSITGLRPKYYRSATAFTDEVCPQIVNALGEDTVSFSVNGDGGATYSAEQVKDALLSTVPGSIVLLHMNHPEKNTAEGVMEAIPILKSRGIRFVRLSEYGLK